MRVADWLSLAIHGPAHFRFLVQPVVAILLGLRDGRHDAEAGKPPYFLSLFQHAGTRKANLEEGLRQTAKPLVIGIVLDAVVQFVLLRRVYVLTAIVIGLLLVALPYALARGAFNRVSRRRLRVA